MKDNRFYVNVEVALCHGDRWLMVIRSPGETHAAGKLSMPGGTVELTDTALGILENAAARECEEEVSIHITNPLFYVNSTYFISDTNEHVLNVVFVSECKNPEQAKVNSLEVVKLSWLTLKEIESYPDVPPWLLTNLRAVVETKKHMHP